MRWLFIDPRDPQEVAFRAAKLRQIDTWWREFAAQTGRLSDLFSRQAEWDLPGWMHEHLGAVDERFMWEFGPAARGAGHRLVITPEADRWLRPLLASVLERAPEIPGWEFYGHRLAEDAEVAQATVAARTGGDLAGTQVEARIGSGRRIDLVFRSPACHGPDDSEAASASFVAAESLLGEDVLDCWIGNIETTPPSKSGWFRRLGRQADGTRAMPLDRLRPTVEALIGSLVEQLPAAPCHEFMESDKWSLIELQPEEQEDFVERTDLFVAVTGCLEMWQGAHGGGIFHSGRYSRQGETFCYLKIDGSEGLGGSRFQDRSDIEDALNESLVPARAGCVVGGGTGLRYSYIDLALTDLSRGATLVRDLLAANGIPERSWLQFFDDDLAREWIGMQDTTPPPPM